MTRSRSDGDYFEKVATATAARLIAVPPGARNVNLNREAFALGRVAHLAPDGGQRALGELCATACGLGLPHREVAATARRAFARGAAERIELAERNGKGTGFFYLHQRPVDERIAAQLAANAENERRRQERQRNRARALWVECQPIAGTLAETYLRSRGILRLVPDAHVGFHPNGGALGAACVVFRVTDADGATCAVQRVPVLADGSDRDRVKGKKSLGSISAGYLQFGDADPKITVVCEGPEDALAIRFALEDITAPANRVVAMLGQRWASAAADFPVARFMADASSVDAAREAAAAAGGRLIDPRPHGDANEMLLVEGKDALFAAIRDAEKVETSEGPQDEPAAGEAPVVIEPTPYVWIDPVTIPPRRWLYGRHLIRRFASATIAPGGLGKSSLSIGESMAMVTGRPLLGQFVPYALGVWYWNLEDPREELNRRIQAAALRHGIERADFEGRLYVDSGREKELVTAIQTRDGAKVLAPVFAALEAAIRRRGIDVLVIDPFVSSHRVTENDNNAIDTVAKEWGRLADRCNCAVELVHHARKTNGEKVTAEHSRGASALVDAARDVRVLNRMRSEEAAKAGVDQHRSFFRVESDKPNLAAPEDARWFQIESVFLPNGQGGPDDSVGVPVPWCWPDAFAGMTSEDLQRVQRALDGKDARVDAQSPKWAGLIVADVLGLDDDDPAHIARIKAMLKEWLKTGALKKGTARDSQRKERPIYVVGEWVNEGAPP